MSTKAGLDAFCHMLHVAGRVCCHVRIVGGMFRVLHRLFSLTRCLSVRIQHVVVECLVLSV